MEEKKYDIYSPYNIIDLRFFEVQTYSTEKIFYIHNDSFHREIIKLIFKYYSENNNKEKVIFSNLEFCHRNHIL